MIKLNSKGLAGAALSAALLAGCGDGGSNHGEVPPPGPVAQTITDVVAYLNQLIAGTADSAEPVDTNALTLATDDASEPAPLQ